MLPDGRSLSDLARDHTQAAIEALVSVLDDKKAPASARVQAASAVLDRGWGRPTQNIEASVSKSFLADELDAAVRREEARLRESRANSVRST